MRREDSVLSSRTRYPTTEFGFMTSCVAESSAAARPAGVAKRTCGAGADSATPFRVRTAVESRMSRLATFLPRPAPVASRMMMFRDETLDALRAVTQAGMRNIAVIRMGTNSVITTNQRERTRSRYSRFATTQNLSMTGHPRSDALRADTLDENLME